MREAQSGGSPDPRLVAPGSAGPERAQYNSLIYKLHVSGLRGFKVRGEKQQQGKLLQPALLRNNFNVASSSAAAVNSPYTVHETF